MYMNVCVQCCVAGSGAVHRLCSQLPGPPNTKADRAQMTLGCKQLSAVENGQLGSCELSEALRFVPTSRDVTTAGDVVRTSGGRA